MLRLDQELPYATTVEIEQFQDRPDGIAEIHAVIWVERDGQKAIVIGQGGAQLKTIGTAAASSYGKHVRPQSVPSPLGKVREGWVDDEAMLKQFGYTDYRTREPGWIIVVMLLEQQPAFVLHTRPYRETSLLLECLTRDHGRIGVVARGVRSQRGRLQRSQLEPFQSLALDLQLRGELASCAGPN